MNVRPSLLCPIDYSDASAGALRYAAAIAEHFVTRLIVLNVQDPLLIAARDFDTGLHWSPEDSERELAGFVSQTFEGDPETLAMCEHEVVVGKPAAEILRIARERSCDLIVMSSHGLTGASRLFFGSTTERVLRETPIPVLVTPALNPGTVCVEDARGLIGQVVVPVDLSPASLYQARVALGLAETLQLPVVFVHVIEPVRCRIAENLHFTQLEASRRALAAHELGELIATVPTRLRPEALVTQGDPAEETARIVRDRRAGLVVMALHSSPPLGPRMGSVTYRTLCMTPTLVLALPPKPAGRSITPAAVPVTADRAPAG